MSFKYFTGSLLFAALALGAPIGLQTRQSCSGVQLVHLAGTGELGLGIVGTPLSRALASSISGTTTKSITYDTSAEYLVTVAAGAAITENYLTSQASACPDQRFVLSGYSKGALVLHRMNLPDPVKSKVMSVVVFGDPSRNINSAAWPINSPSVDKTPRDGRTTGQNVASFCNDRDLFCDVPGSSLPAHLAYSVDGSIGVAAEFAKAQA